MQHLFGQKFEHLHHKYPELTELDIQVLTLIGLGVDTTEIIQITDMSKRTYYNSLRISSDGWLKEDNDYIHFIVYILGMVLREYSQFEQLIGQLSSKKVSKPDRVKALFAERTEPLAKREILAMCPDISKITVERSLNDMLKEGYLEKVGAGPATAYVVKK